ncbi:VOC family protein [uncultured Flavobacterium sp.]|uniref:VOC family protein n=1 Tax=uncultured Flavobacterium sp. TaxID=165435 RepID=UPI0025F63AC1|nr:VOC family protein [uncultured Flavobacterium sp.]
MQKITPFLWISANLEEAVEYYTALFKNSKITSLHKMGDGSFMTAALEIEGQHLMLLSGGQFEFNESVSFFIRCETQQEVDYYWGGLTANGGSESMCGWLKDKYGLSWQVIPNVLMDLMSAGNEGSQRVMQAMMQMRRIDIAKLEEAYNTPYYE